MGAWGSGVFDNDEAMDWCGDWADAPEGEGTDDEPGRLAFIIGAMAVALEEEEFIDIDTAECALAAAEAVAAAVGKPCAAIKSAVADDESLFTLKKWAASKHAETLRTAKVRELARQAVAAAASDRSEAAELWSESDNHAAWRQGIDDLLTRLAD